MRLEIDRREPGRGSAGRRRPSGSGSWCWDMRGLRTRAYQRVPVGATKGSHVAMNQPESWFIARARHEVVAARSGGI